MTNRPVRVALLLLFVAAMGATAYLFWIAEREARSTEAIARSFDDRARAVETQIAGLRSTEQAYVAAGQEQDTWFTRSAKALETLRTGITDLRATASAPEGATSFDDAVAALQNFEQMDRRARDDLRTHQPSLASALIFADGFDSTNKVAAAIERARTAERAAHDAQIAALRRREVFSLGAAAAASLLIVLLLVPIGEQELPLRTSTERPVPAFAPPRTSPTRTIDALDVEGWSPAKREQPADERPEPVPAPPVVEAPVEVASLPLVLAAPEPAPQRIDLPRVSSICNDLARVVDTRTLPSLLERAADAIDAAGIVLWVADPDGRELAAIMAHGYQQNLVLRLGTIARDAENATAAAFRTSLIQTVKADSVSNGAIAAPLVGASGCVGVMAAEIRDRGEQDDTVLAAAGIIAAQLATLVAPPSSRAKAEAAG